MFDPNLSVVADLPEPPGAVWSRIQVNPEVLTPEVRKSVGWTALIGEAMDSVDLRSRNVTGFHYAAAGLMDDSVDLGLEYADGRRFGVILYCDAFGRDVGAVREQVPYQVFEPVRVNADMAFPVTVRPGNWRDSSSSSAGGSPPSAAGLGQLACWVTTRSRKHAGWLTAAHAAPLLGAVLDAAGACTDAAVVAGPMPAGLAHATAYRGVAATVQVLMWLHGGLRQATVLDVSTDFDIYTSPRFPVRFSLNVAGVSGDSGGYIEQLSSPTSGRSPVGIYLGAFVPSTAPTGQAPSGYGLALYQLEHSMQMEIYR